MNKFVIYTLFYIFSIATSYAQIGICTENPMASLDVNGTIAMRTGIFKVDNLSPGREGQLLMSQGEGQPPKWVTTVGTRRPGDTYNLYSTYVAQSSQETFATREENAGQRAFNKDESITKSNWKIIDELTYDFEVQPLYQDAPEERDNYYTYSFETIIVTTLMTHLTSYIYVVDGQGYDIGAYAWYGNSVDYAVGLFLNGELKGVYSSTFLYIYHSSYQKINGFFLVENLKIGTYKAQLGFLRVSDTLNDPSVNPNTPPAKASPFDLFIGCRPRRYVTGNDFNTSGFTNKIVIEGKLYYKNNIPTN